MGVVGCLSVHTGSKEVILVKSWHCSVLTTSVELHSVFCIYVPKMDE